MFLLREQERYLLRIQELEIAVARLGEESIDKATLLETAQSDKETISRSALKLLEITFTLFTFLPPKVAKVKMGQNFQILVHPM